jgi:molecular chaperone DnaK
MDISTDTEAIERLRAAAQRAKHDLSGVASSKVHIGELLRLPSGKALEYEKLLRRDELELWSAPLMRRLDPPVREALRRANRTREELQEVLLVGGMMRMPAVRREIARIIGREPRVLDNPEEVVAVGAALEVARLEGAIEGVLVIDVAARGVCVSTAGGECDLVIAQSCVVPTREHRVFPTRADDQPRIEFDLWEGDSPDSSRNRHLGRYAVLDLPEAAAGDVLVLVEITLDADGTVRLSASELVSGERLQLEQIYHAGLARSEVVRLQRQLAEAS